MPLPESRASFTETAFMLPRGVSYFPVGLEDVPQVTRSSAFSPFPPPPHPPPTPHPPPSHTRDDIAGEVWVAGTGAK
jgi:hypothetical protein